MPTRAKRPNPQPPKKKSAGKAKVSGGMVESKGSGKKPGGAPDATEAEVELPVLVRKFNQWAEECGENPEPKYDNQPIGILETFPKLNNGGVAETYLEQHLWWWRKANTDGAPSIFRQGDSPQWTQLLFGLYQDRFELSAYYYEMRARFGERYAWDFGRPWIYCSRQQRCMLDCLWPSPYPAKNWLPSDIGKREWQQLVGVSFNLRLNSTVLVAQFMEEIERLRHRHGIPKPAPGGGVRRKPMTWRPIELLDIRRYDIRDLDDAERSQVSKAMVAYEAACRETDIEP